MPPIAKKFDKDWFYDAVKLLVAVFVSTATSVVTATWTIRGIVDDHDKRISVNSALIAEIKENAKDVKDDLRDIRTDVKALLRKP